MSSTTGQERDPWAGGNSVLSDDLSAKRVSEGLISSTSERLVFETPLSLEQRLTNVKAARNPLLEASKTLLRALADMPDNLEEKGMLGWCQLLGEELHVFTTLCEQANLRRDHVLAVRYALCTALDEAASLKPWAGGVGASTGPWSSHALLQTFHQEGDGGQKVFLLIGRLASNPQEHLDVLEIMFHLLGLGFEGHYRTQADGRRMLETVRHRLFTLLAEGREAVPREISLRWLGVPEGKFRLIRSVPAWVTALVLGLALLGMFTWFKYNLVNERNTLEAKIREIGALAPKPSKLRLKELLEQEITSGRVQVEEDDNHSKVSFKGDDMFLPGQAVVNPKATSMLDKVAGGINEVAGKVEITGHSDNQPIKTVEFPDNKVLSEKRAESVAKMLRSRGVETDRIGTLGAGDSQPVDPANTPAARAKNRRVEILVRAN